MPKGQFATHLYLKRNNYCFRWTFPERFASIIGKRELRRSMQTGNIRLATRRAVQLAARLHALHVRLDKETPMQTLTPPQIESLLRTYVRESLDELEHGLASHPVGDPPAPLDTDLAWIDSARTAPDKVFHSFRHTVLDACKQQGIAMEIAQEIAGHTNESITYGTYGKALRPEVQLQYLTQLEFGVDLSHLKGAWRVLMPR